MSAVLLVQTRKEVRALLPWTIGVAIATVALAAVAHDKGRSPNYREVEVLFVLAYTFGVLAVSALSIGQELTHGTLAALLVQPLDRLKVLVLKLSVLAIALIGLGLMVTATFQQTYLPASPELRRLLIWGPVAAGIGLAPLLTVLTRRPLAGVVFSPAISGLILAISERLYPLHKGPEAWTITWYGTLIVSAAGLATLVVRFRTLEVAGDGRGGTAVRAVLGTPAEAVAYAPTTRRPWVWLLVKKELRLQQMTFAVSGLYVLGAVASMVLAARNPLILYPTFGPISLIHAYCIPLIAGSIASAEERQMGTLAGQILQPRNIRLQWAIKTVVTIGIVLVLAFGLPALLMAVHQPADAFRIEADFALGIALLCAAAMWVSSISTNSLWALLGSFPSIALAGIIGGAGYQFLRLQVGAWMPHQHWDNTRWRLLAQAMERSNHSRAWTEPFWRAGIDLQHSLNIISTSLIVGFGLLVLYFAARNHRTLDRNIRRLTWQLLTLATFAAAATMGYLALRNLSNSWMMW